MYFKTLILMALLELTATNPSIQANIGFDVHIVDDDGRVPSEMEDLGEDPHWCAILDAEEKCSNPIVSRDCKKLCSSGEDPHWCAIVDAEEKCSNPIVLRDCKKLCSSAPTTFAPTTIKTTTVAPTTITTTTIKTTTTTPTTIAPTTIKTTTTAPTTIAPTTIKTTTTAPTTIAPTTIKTTTTAPTTIAPTTIKTTTTAPTTIAPTTIKTPGCNTTGMISIGSEQFKMFNDHKYTWAETKQRCSDDGLIMAEPQDPPTVVKYLWDTYRAHIWLGAAGNGSTFVWNSGGTLVAPSSYWYAGPPTGDKFNWCLLSYYSSYPYYAYHCTHTTYTICQCPEA